MKRTLPTNSFVVFFILFQIITAFVAPTAVLAQIYAPEGLNMPGSWNTWTNPPTNNLALANSTQVAGGRIVKINTGTTRWQTTLKVAAGGGDLSAGTYNWLFTSGPSGGYFNNKWANVNVVMNSLQTYTHQGATDNSITLVNGKWYTMNWKDAGYTSTQAIFMETSAEPVTITQLTQNPTGVTYNDAVQIELQFSASPATEEKCYVRYSTDNWATSLVVSATINGATASAVIPAQEAGLTVSYYAFTSTINNPLADYDMVTLRYNNNGDENYSYTVFGDLCGLQLVSTNPQFPMESSALEITFNAVGGNQALLNYAGDVYVHTGVITNLSSNDADWKYTKTSWGTNTPETKLTRTGTNTYTLSIADLKTWYGVPAEEQILKLAMVFRSDGTTPAAPSYLVHKTADESDILVKIYENTLNVKLLNPSGNLNLIDNELNIAACAVAVNHSNLALFVNSTLIGQTATGDYSDLIDLSSYPAGQHWIKAVATAAKATARDSVSFFIRPAATVADLPAGLYPGINYVNESTVTLVLHDPPTLKEHAFVIGDFNGWSLTTAAYMNETTDGKYFWKTITGLIPGTEYAYQYYIDGELKLADPYCDKVLDPWNDQYISSTIYPNLKPYPSGQTTGIVSVLQTNQEDYNWEVTNFSKPDNRDLVIYELHIRDFVASDDIKDVTAKLDYLQRLGVNAIELMPVNEFEGNDSWGYNPSFYFAPDKAYGTKNDYKRFVDECHKRGMAVIIDMVLNHSFSQSPFVQMYFDAEAGDYGEVTATNPWYNVSSPNPAWSWGFDFNHESVYTQQLMDRITDYWLNEYNADGFRFDFTKGFTNTAGEGWNYDASRIAILKRMADAIWSAKPGAYVILEHLTDNSEETVLANYGLMLWGNMEHQYSEASMGYASDFSWGIHSARGFSYHNLVSYMESHDEERQMYSSLTYGNSTNPSHDVKNEDIALARSGMSAAFYLLTPGPKMIWQFGELGYDKGINHCPNGTYNSDCRTSRKPIPWDAPLNYDDDTERLALFDRYAELNRLKTQFAVFRTGNINYDLDESLKRLHLNENMDGSGRKVTLLGNFGVTAQSITPYFQQTGLWYEHFTGTTLNVSSTTAPILLQPGEYRLYSDSPFYSNFYPKATGDLTNVANWGSNSDGSGSNPANFSSAHVNYQLQNRNNFDLSSDWTLTGTDSRLIVGNGTNATNLNVEAGALLTADYLQINAHATVNVKPGGKMTISGTVDNKAGAAGLIIESNATGTGSLLHEVSDLDGSVQRFVSGGGYHFVSVPLTATSNPTAGLFMNSYLYHFDAPTQLWEGMGTSTSTILPVDEGYMAWYTGSQTTFNFEGKLIAGNFEAATNSGAAAFQYNLVPNPYPSAIDWQAASGWTKTNLNNAVYIWNRNYATIENPNGQYASYVNGISTNGGSRYIAPSQSFFVETNGGGSPALSMTDAVRVHSSDPFLKETQAAPALRIQVSGEAGNDETVIYLAEGATSAFDAAFDASKLAGSEALPQLGSFSEEGRKLSINGLSPELTEQQIELSFSSANEGNHQLMFGGLESFDSGWNIYLEDLLTGSLTDLRLYKSYSFTHQNTSADGRFKLRLLKATVMEEVTGDGAGPFFYPNPAKDNINIVNARGGNLTIYDCTGHVALKKRIESDEVRIILNNLKIGIYYISIKIENNETHFRFITY